MEATDEQILKWKAKYGEDACRLVSIVLKPEAKDDQGNIIPEEKADYIIRVPGRAELEAVGQHGIDKNVSKANQVLISNCVLSGDRDLIEKDGSVYATVLDHINSLIRKRESSIKKL